MNWSEMKESVRTQMSLDPQRATLSTKAWEAVESGLRHLESVGFRFEIAPKGTLGELVQLQLSPPARTRSLSIAEAVEQVKSNELTDSNPFEAKPTNVTLN